MSADPLAELALALRARGADASRELPEARALLARFCRGYLGDPDDAEDAVQDVLARAALAPSGPAAPRAWLLAIARNRCRDVLRARAARPEGARLATSFDVARETAGPVTRLVGAESASELAVALTSLSEDERELLRLRYADDLSRAEVAELVGATEELVKSRLFEAIEKLRRVLRAREGRELAG